MSSSPPLAEFLSPSLTISFTLFPFLPASLSISFLCSMVWWHLEFPAGLKMMENVQKREKCFFFPSLFFFLLKKGSIFCGLLLFALINNPWAQWRGCCVFQWERKRVNFPLQMDVGSSRKPSASPLNLGRIISLSHRQIQTTQFTCF